MLNESKPAATGWSEKKGVQPLEFKRSEKKMSLIDDKARMKQEKANEWLSKKTERQTMESPKHCLHPEIAVADKRGGVLIFN